MLKVIQNSGSNNLRLAGLLVGLATLSALVLAPAAPASAQGVPAGLLRLDTPQPANDSARLADLQRSKVRSAYARTRKVQAQ